MIYLLFDGHINDKYPLFFPTCDISTSIDFESLYLKFLFVPVDSIHFSRSLPTVRFSLQMDIFEQKSIMKSISIDSSIIRW